MRTSNQLALLAVAAFASPAIASHNHFRLKKLSSLVIFGDSYTDQGVHSYIPSSDGTLPETGTELSTGGRVWPQYISQYSSINVYDYAVSGAFCDNSQTYESRNGIKQDQIPSFLTDLEWRNKTTHKPAIQVPADQTLYAIWIGTNDLGDAAYITDMERPRGLSLTEFTDCVFERLDEMYDAGARNFVIMNTIPLDLLAQYGLPENGGKDSTRYWEDKTDYNKNITQISEKMRQYTDMVNEVYKYQAPYQVKLAKRYPHSALAIFDTHSLMLDMWHHPKNYFNGTAPLNVTGFITECKDTTCSKKSDWDSFMWYDELHPSEQTDRIVAKEFLKVVNGRSKYADYWQG